MPKAEAVVLRTAWTSDLVMAICALPLCAAGIVAPFLFDPPAQTAVWPDVLFYGFQIVVCILMAAWTLCTGVGGVWRLIDRSPAITADRQGIRFHPSICPRPISWREVAVIRPEKGEYAQLRIDLTRRVWSTTLWATGRSIELSYISLQLSAGEARATMKAMRALSPYPFDPDGRVRNGGGGDLIA